MTGIYVGLFFWSRVTPLPPVLIGLIIYVLATVANLALGEFSVVGLVLRGIVIRLLIRALVLAAAANEAHV
jgi:hypothetical protein